MSVYDDWKSHQDPNWRPQTNQDNRKALEDILTGYGEIRFPSQIEADQLLDNLEALIAKREAAAQTNGVAWAIGVIDELPRHLYPHSTERCILWRMRQILNMYRMAKEVQMVIHEVDNIAKLEQTRKPTTHMTPAAATVKTNYAKKYHATYFKVNSVCLDAINNEYLREGIRHDPGGEQHDGITEIETLGLTTKGRALIDTFAFVPWGLLKAWILEYGVVFSAITALAAGAVIRELLKLVF